MNSKLKEEVTEDEVRLKRLQTQVLKIERQVGTLQKKVSPTAPSKVTVDAQIYKLQALIMDVERKNEAMRRNLLELKHVSPSNPKQKLRRTQTQKLAKAAPKFLGSEKTETDVGKDEDSLDQSSVSITPELIEQQLLVQALEVELTRAQIRRQALETHDLVAPTADLASRPRASARIDALAIENLQREIKEMDARLMILEYTQQQTSAAFQAHREQEKSISQELADLNAQLEDRRAAVRKLEHDRNILAIAGGSVEAAAAGSAGGGAAALQKALREELATLQAENRAARTQAFGGAVVHVQAQTLDDERVAVAGRIDRLRAEAARQQEAEAVAMAEAARLEVEKANLSQEVSRPPRGLSRRRHSSSS